MLVLSRKVNEKLVITTPEGRTITVVVVALERGQAQIGVRADRDVKVLRGELAAREPAPAKE